MSKKMILGVVTGIAIVSVASLLMSKNSKYNWKSVCESAGDVLDGIRDRLSAASENDQYDGIVSSTGQSLARKAKQHAIHKFADQQR